MAAYLNTKTPYIQAFNPFYNLWSNNPYLHNGCATNPSSVDIEMTCSGSTRIFLMKTFFLIMFVYCIVNIILILYSFDKLKKENTREEFRTTWCVIFPVILVIVFISYFSLHRWGQFNQFGSPRLINIGSIDCKDFCGLGGVGKVGKVGKNCSLFNSSLFGTISFLIFGGLLIAFSIEYQKNLNDSSSSWNILGDSSIGMGVIYLIIGLCLIFTMIRSPCGTNWGKQLGIPNKVIFFVNILVSLLLLFFGVGIPILANMNKL